MLRFYLELDRNLPTPFEDAIFVCYQFKNNQSGCNDADRLEEISIATMDSRDLDPASVFDPRYVIQTRQAVFGAHRKRKRRQARNIFGAFEEFPNDSSANVLDFLSQTLRFPDPTTSRRLRNIVLVSSGLERSSDALMRRLGVNWHYFAPIVGYLDPHLLARKTLTRKDVGPAFATFNLVHYFEIPTTRDGHHNKDPIAVATHANCVLRLLLMLGLMNARGEDLEPRIARLEALAKAQLV
ncbi:MAG: hypothetical protein Q9157_001359 [Trypethelium eluteriae]